MPLNGSLRQNALSLLIQVYCAGNQTARLAVRNEEGQGEVYIAGGDVVHARCDDLTGPAALSALLAWQDGAFTVEEGIAAPERTITVPWAELIKTTEERAAGTSPSLKDSVKSEAGPFKSLLALPGVRGLVHTALDGTVLSSALDDGDDSLYGTSTALIGTAADGLGEILGLGPPGRGLGTTSAGRFVVLKYVDGYIGLLLNDSSSPALVATAADQILHPAGPSTREEA